METLPIEVWNVEPMKGALSTRMTFAPFCAAERAHASPARPEPMTTMSARKALARIAGRGAFFLVLGLAQPPNASVPPSTAAPMTNCLLLNDAMM